MCIISKTIIINGFECKEEICVPEQCGKEQSCPNKFICENGQCTKEPCMTSKECPTGEDCVAGTCKPETCSTDSEECECKTDTDCGQEQICNCKSTPCKCTNPVERKYCQFFHYQLYEVKDKLKLESNRIAFLFIYIHDVSKNSM